MGVAERRLRERQERVHSILEAALRVFAREGLRPATMEAIAAEAQLGKGTIYYYFSSKETLLEELMLSVVEEYFNGLLEGALGRKSPAAIAQGITQRLLEHYKREPELFRVIHMVLGEPEPRPRKALRAFVDAHLRWLEQLEAAVSKTLEEHGIPVQAFIYLIGTYAHGLLFAAVAGRDPDRLQAEAAATFTALLDRLSPQQAEPLQTRSSSSLAQQGGGPAKRENLKTKSEEG
jgi:AcrR family transcriptional regulator